MINPRLKHTKRIVKDTHTLTEKKTASQFVDSFSRNLLMKIHWGESTNGLPIFLVMPFALAIRSFVDPESFLTDIDGFLVN